MKNIRVFYLKIFIFLVVKFSLYLNRHVFVMCGQNSAHESAVFHSTEPFIITFLLFQYDLKNVENDIKHQAIIIIIIIIISAMDKYDQYLQTGCNRYSFSHNICSSLNFCLLMFSMLRKNSRTHSFEILSYFSQKKDLTFHAGDNLHEMSDPIFWEKKKSIINLLSAKLAQSMVKVYL